MRLFELFINHTFYLPKPLTHHTLRFLDLIMCRRNNFDTWIGRDAASRSNPTMEWVQILPVQFLLQGWKTFRVPKRTVENMVHYSWHSTLLLQVSKKRKEKKKTCVCRDTEHFQLFHLVSFPEENNNASVHKIYRPFRVSCPTRIHTSFYAS